MISIAIVIGLAVTFVSGTHLERHVIRGEPYLDLCDCDNDNWAWDNDDPNVHAIHRDCRESDMITSCYYGEWAVTEPPQVDDPFNSYGYTQWAILERDIDLNDPEDVANPPYIELDEYPVIVKFRLWAFCDFEQGSGEDEFTVILRDDWATGGGDAHDQLDDTFGRSRNILVKQRLNRGNCNDWTGQVDETNLEFWDEIACNANSAASCYYDYEQTWMATGPFIRIRWETTLDNGPTNEQWAFSNLEFCAGPECFVDECPCCQADADASNAEGRRCKVFREERNCESAGCNWQSSNAKCNIPCCRKNDPASKRKPKCKTLNDDLDRCGNQRGDCFVSNCDCQGFYDNGNAFDDGEGRGVCAWDQSDRQCFHEYPVDPQPNVGRD